MLKESKKTGLKMNLSFFTNGNYPFRSAQIDFPLPTRADETFLCFFYFN